MNYDQAMNLKKYIHILKTTKRKQCQYTLHDPIKKAYCAIGIAALNFFKDSIDYITMPGEHPLQKVKKMCVKMANKNDASRLINTIDGSLWFRIFGSVDQWEISQKNDSNSLVKFRDLAVFLEGKYGTEMFNAFEQTKKDLKEKEETNVLTTAVVESQRIHQDLENH